MGVATAPPPQPAEVIRADETYGKAEFWRRTRISKHAWASALRDGLKVRRHGRRVYVIGQDWFDFLAGRK